MKSIKTTICLLFCLTASSANAVIMSLGVFTDNGGGSYTLSNGNGSFPDKAVLPTVSVENFLGLTTGTLDGLASNDAIEGSALKDTVAVLVGTVFSFDWTWTSTEADPSPIANDFAFYSLSLGLNSVFADTSTTDGTSGSVSVILNTAGNLTFGIGVMDDAFNDFDSVITVSNIQLTPPNNSAGIPEPASLALLGLGLLGMGAFRIKQAA